MFVRGDARPENEVVDHLTDLSHAKIADAVRLTKVAPGQYTWAATPGQTDVIMLALFKLAGVDLLKKSDSNFTVAMQDLAHGHLHLVATSVPPAHPSHPVRKGEAPDGGEPAAIATAPPEALTASEAGYPEITVSGSVVLLTSREASAE